MNRPLIVSVLLLGTLLSARATLHSQSAPVSSTTRIIEQEQRLGDFTLGGQTFGVIARIQEITPAASGRQTHTISAMEIRDAGGAIAYQQTFPAAVTDGRFLHTLAMFPGILQGAGGSALLLRYLEDPAPEGGGESWQMFGMVNGRLTRYTAPAPLGQGGMAVNGVLAGVMLQGGIGVVPLASAAEALEFRVWTGNYFVGVPVRIDWAKGQWSEAEQCFSNDGGALQPTGCNLRVTPIRRPMIEGSLVLLNAEPADNAYTVERVTVHSDSLLEISAARAVVKWQGNGDRFSCAVENPWLHLRIDGKDGWIHSQADLTALGLPASPPPQ